MSLIRALFYLSVSLYYFSHTFCADDGGGKKNSKLKSVYVLLQSIDGKGNDYLSVNNTDPLTGTAMVTVMKPFKMSYDIYFYYPENKKLLYSYDVCQLFSEKRDKSKIPDGLFPREMVQEIFTGQRNCQFEVGKKDITVAGSLPFDPDQQAGFSFPDKDRFKMRINVVDKDGKGDPKNNYIFSSFWKVAVVDKSDASV